MQGARQPRVCNFPAYTYTAGPAAAQLAAEAGLHLDPWQRDVLERSLGVRDSDGLWSAFEVGVMVSRQNGKGSILEARVIAGLLLFEERLQLWSAHEFKTAQEAMRRVTDLFRSTPDLHRRVKRYNTQRGEEGIELYTGQRLKFVARSKASGRGFSGDLVILDEAYELSDAEMEALMPTMSARANPQIWYTSSPPLDSVTGAHLFGVRRRGEQPDPDRLAWFDWGAAGELEDLDELGEDGKPRIDVADPALWAQTNPAYGIRIQDWFIERELAALSRKGFARERLGIWPKDLSASFQIIDEQAWEERRDAGSFITGDYVLSCAVSVDRSRGAICAAGYRQDFSCHVEVTGTARVVDARPGTAWIPDRLAAIAAKRKPRVIVIDAGAPQGSLIGDCERLGLEITKMTSGEVAMGYGMFYDGVQGDDEDGRDLWHLGQPELTASVAGAITRQMGPAGTTWDARNAQVDITPLRAATDALYGLKKYGHKGPPVLVGSLLANG